MLNTNNIDLSFKTEAEAQAFSSWYLGATISQIKEEFEGEDALWLDFIARRERRLKVQLDDLRSLSFESAIPCPIRKVNYFKIANQTHRNPLSSIGSERKSSRFNYKNTDELRNRVIYFGQDKSCCYAEMFHLDIQKYNYAELTKRSPDEIAGELPRPAYQLHEFEVELENVLVLTGNPAHKALGVSAGVLNDEWYYVNDEYEIPTASQILGTIARRKGYSGILYASVRNQTKHNLVVFEENAGELNFRQVSVQQFDPTGL